MARVRVTWGDHTSSTISQPCDKLTKRKAADLFAPHRYALSGSFHVSAALVQQCAGGTDNRAVFSADASTRVSTGNAGTPPNVTPNPSASQWTSFGQVPSIANPTYTTVAEPPISGGCDMAGGWQQMPAGGPASSETAEVAIDVADCSVLTETGTPSASVVNQTFNPSTFSPGNVTAGSNTPSTAAASGNATAAYTVYQAEVEFAAQWLDHVGGIMNQVDENLVWRYNGGCTTENVTWGIGEPGPGIGWHLDWTNPPGGSGVGHWRTCSADTINGRAGYSDNNFCNGNATYNLYNNVELQGWANGDAWDYKDGTANGSSCASSEKFVQIFHRDYGPKL